MSYSGAIGRLITFAIGGGWGSEDEKDNYSKVAVIRGTDIPRVTNGDFSTVPFRYEDDKKIANRKLNVGDIVLETAGGSSANGQFTGRTLLVTEEVLEKLGTTICASFCKRLEVDKNLVNPGYFYHYMQDLYKSGRVASYDSQSTGISNFQFDVFKTTEHLDLGSMKHQEQVSSLLSGIQNQINLNSQISKTLEDIAQTIFKSWFIDFDPVKAKMAGEKPVGMDEATAALFPDSMEDSELGLIPRGWGIKNLSALSDISKITVNPQKHLHTIFTQYSIPAFDSGGYPVEGTGSSILSNKFVLGGSAILVSKLNPRTTRVWTVLEPPASGICSTEFIVLMPRSDTLLPFINSIVRDSKFLEALASMATGSTGSRQRVRPEDIFQIGVFVPSGDLIAKLFEVQFPMLQHIQNLKDENQSLSKLRDSLLPRLISGELQISEEMLVT
jgi:type I restriction enzyme S subunit